MRKEFGRKPLQNLTRMKEIKAKELEDFESMVEAIYWVWNDPFYVREYSYTERGQQLVKVGCNPVSEFNYYLLIRGSNGF